MIYDFNKRQNQQSLGGKLGINQYGQGGSMGRADVDKELNNFEGGGTHEQNSLGGIPLGVGSNGKPNSVEENETAFELKSGKYIFSDRLIIE